MRHGRSFPILVSALLAACLMASAADAQSRSNTSGRRAGPELPPSGHQTEAIDLNEGKSPAELFQNGCAVCHQSVANLAKGRSAGELVGFLRQHYTSGAQYAAALAGYLAASSGRGGTAGRPPVDRPPANIGNERKPAQEAARPQEPREPREPREPAAKRRPPVAARAAPAPAAPPPAVATEAAAHSGDAPAAAPPPPAEEKPPAPEIPL